MSKSFIFYSFLAGIICVLSGCSSVSDASFWSDEKKITNDDKRITILPTPNQLHADPEVARVDVTLPAPTINYSWPTEDNIQNPLLPLAIKPWKKIDIGSSADSSVHMSSSPLIFDKKVFVLDGKKKVTSYHTSNMKKIWSVELVDYDDTLPGGGIAYLKDTLFVTLGHNFIYALDASSGTLLWKRKINGIVRSAPAVHINSVVVTSIDNQTYALHPKTGNIQWIHTGIREATTTLGSPKPAIYDNVVIVPHSSGEIYALTLFDGQELWSDNVVLHSVSSFTLADIDTKPVIDGSTVYVNSNSGILAAFELYSGNRIWEREIKSSFSPWVSGNALFVLTSNAELVCIIKQTGHVKWITQLQRYENPSKKKGKLYWTQPILANDHIWTVNSEGDMVRVHALTGKVIDSIDTGSDVFVSPAIANKMLYLLDDDADLRVLNNQ